MWLPSNETAVGIYPFMRFAVYDLATGRHRTEGYGDAVEIYHTSITKCWMLSK